MFAITGATGNTGRVVVEKLLAEGQRVRAIGRDGTRLAPLVSKGAEPFVADVTDASALGKAFEGAEAVYAMVPPNIGASDVRGYQERAGDAITAALKAASVAHVVLLSSIGADKAERTGPVVGLHNFEQKLSAVAGLNAYFLRAGYFMENLLPQVNVLRMLGSLAGPVRSDLRLPMIATRDIGEAAAQILGRHDFAGKQAHELLGQRDVDYREVSSVIGKAIGKGDLSYVQLPPEQLKPALTQMGMSANMADLLLEMAAALNSGYMVALERRSPQNTTSTSLEAFVAQEFVPRSQPAAMAGA